MTESPRISPRSRAPFSKPAESDVPGRNLKMPTCVCSKLRSAFPLSVSPRFAGMLPMKTFLVHHTPKSPDQDTWAVSFSLPYIASEYAPVGNGVWYVRTWLGAHQIKRRLAILFDHPDELAVHELGRADQRLSTRLQWLQGRLEDEEPAASWQLPRGVWTAFQSAVSAVARPSL